MNRLRSLAMGLSVAAILLGAAHQWGPSVDWSASPVADWWNQSSGSVSAVIVLDTEKPSPSIAAVVLDPRLDACKAAGVLKVVSIHEVGPDLPAIRWALDAAKEQPLPALVWRRRTAKPTVQALPTAAAIQKILGDKP